MDAAGSHAELAACITLCYLTSPPEHPIPLALCLYLCYKNWRSKQEPPRP